MFDDRTRNLSSLVEYTTQNFNSDVYQLITLEAPDLETEIKMLTILANKILQKHNARLFLSFNNHELGSYFALEILEVDLKPEIEGYCYQIADELNYEY